MVRERGVTSLPQIQPLHVANWIEVQGARACGAQRQAAACRHPPPVRLAGHRPGRAGESGGVGARAAPCGALGQDAGAGAGGGARLLDSIDASTRAGLARPGADLADGL